MIRKSFISLICAFSFLAQFSTVVSGAGLGAKPEVFAIIIGNNDGKGLLPDLRFADDDAVKFFSLVSTVADSGNIYLFVEPDDDTSRAFSPVLNAAGSVLPPTRKNIFSRVDEIKAKIESEALKYPERKFYLYFFYSGHGESGRLFLKDSRDGLSAFISGEDLRNAFAGSRAVLNQIFIDACRSQSLFRSRGPVTFGPDFSSDIDGFNSRLLETSGNIGVITSTTLNSPSIENPRIAGGTFSHVLISGLAGAADINGDGIITYDELMAFISFYLKKDTGNQPWFSPPGNDINAEVMNLMISPQGINFGYDAYGHIIIFDEKEKVLHYEFNKPVGCRTRILLPPGKYQVLRVDSGVSGSAASVNVAAGSYTTVTAADFTLRVAFLMTPGAERGGQLPQMQAGLGNFSPSDSNFAYPFADQIVQTFKSGYVSGVDSTVSLRNPRKSQAVSAGAGTESPIIISREFAKVLKLRYLAFVSDELLFSIVGDYSVISDVEFGKRVAINRMSLEPGVGYGMNVSRNIRLCPSFSAGYQYIFKLSENTVEEGDPYSWRTGPSLWSFITLGRGYIVSIDADARLNGLKVAGRETYKFNVGASMSLLKVF